MSQTITVTVTDAEYKCMEYIASDVTEWADNALTNRARIAGDKIIALLVEHCNANDIQLATGRDAQITQAYTLNVVSAATSSTPQADAEE